ncbi:MAG: hypothetical protein ACO1SV_20615 [Fimbriimonas sp.]
MRKGLSYLAFPAVCLTVLIGLVACGGSGGNPVEPIPTVTQAAAAVNQASTPAEGTAAAAKVLTYFGSTQDEIYNDIPAADRQQFNDAFGAALAFDNQTPITLTYGQALASFAETFNTDITVEVALAALTTDLGTAATDATTPGRKELLLLIELEGSDAAATKPLSVAGTLSLARWYATRFASSGSALTRSACTDACEAQYSQGLRSALVEIRAAIATATALKFQYEVMKQRPEYAHVVTRFDEIIADLNRVIAHYGGTEVQVLTAIGQVRAACVVHCHQQS